MKFYDPSNSTLEIPDRGSIHVDAKSVYRV
jgi:hypothetical protein